MTDPAVPHVAAELEPRFLVTVTLDGDDDPQYQAEETFRWIRRELARMERLGVIRAYTIARAP